MFIMVLHCVYASESVIQIFGDSEAQKDDDKMLTVKLLSSDTIGIISGKITGNENVQIIKVNGKNNWNLTYNSETGVFNVYKAEGAKEEEIITIEYKAINENATGKIIISNLKATSIDYISETLPNTEKNIQIKGQEKMEEETQKEEQNQIAEEAESGKDINTNEEGKDDKEEQKEIAEEAESREDINTKEERKDNKEEQKEKNEEAEKREDVNTKEAERKDIYGEPEKERSIENDSKQESNIIKTLPKTGEFNVIIPIIIVVALLGIIFFWIKCNSYKDYNEK